MGKLCTFTESVSKGELRDSLRHRIDMKQNCSEHVTPRTALEHTHHLKVVHSTITRLVPRFAAQHNPSCTPHNSASTTEHTPNELGETNSLNSVCAKRQGSILQEQ
ncbi:hypothetical protein V6N11_079603 [Hibiscus sabdariffa]|uniref:Uncharacterized protein n=1 Tax=Hibiscus sabdariffa TaxID=183260 RepID=A0ABR2RWJ5_9ROSI